MVYNIITFGGTAQATIFHALEGVFRENAHAIIKASKFFGISRVHLAKIKSQTNWAVICTRKFPQRLDYFYNFPGGSICSSNRHVFPGGSICMFFEDTNFPVTGQ